MPWQDFIKEQKSKAETGDSDAQGICSILIQSKAILGTNDQAYNLAEKSMEASSAFGTYALGRCHENGIVTTKNITLSNTLYETSYSQLVNLSESGNMFAAYLTGVAIAFGQGVTKSEVKGVKWIKKAADQGLATAQYFLGGYYLNGRSLDKPDKFGLENRAATDYEVEGVKWIKKAADQGLGIAQLKLGVCYLSGEGVAVNEGEGLRWIRMAADQGLPEAQRSLGVCYANGIGVIKDEGEGLRWIQMAADQGLPEAQLALGGCYAAGLGIVKNEAEGVKWIRKAADQGLPDAQGALSVCYKNGIGVTKNETEAAKWESKAPQETRRAELKNEIFKELSKIKTKFDNDEYTVTFLSDNSFSILNYDRSGIQRNSMIIIPTNGAELNPIGNIEFHTDIILDNELLKSLQSGDTIRPNSRSVILTKFNLLKLIHENYELYKKWKSIAEENKPAPFIKDFSGNRINSWGSWWEFGKIKVAFNWDGEQATMAACDGSGYTQIILNDSNSIETYNQKYMQIINSILPILSRQYQNKRDQKKQNDKMIDDLFKTDNKLKEDNNTKIDENAMKAIPKRHISARDYRNTRE